MVMPMRKLIVLLSLVLPAAGSNLSTTGLSLPPARLAVSVSYTAGGYPISNLEVPSVFRSWHF